MSFSDVAYLAGALRDGSIFYEKSSRNYKVVWYEQNEAWLRDSIARRVKVLFGKEARINEYKPRQFRALVSSQAVHDYFVREFRFVSPQVFWGTPPKIRQADDETIAAYVAGFFDAEGDVGKWEAGFSQKNLESLQFIKEWLDSRGIPSSKIFVADKKSGTHRFYVRSRFLEPFSRCVPFEHPDKRLELEQVLQQT